MNSYPPHVFNPRFVKFQNLEGTLSRRFAVLLLGGALCTSYHFIFPGIRISDFFFLGLFLMLFLKVALGIWRISSFAKWSIGYAFLQWFAAGLNFCITDTVFINFARNFFEGVVAFVVVENVLKSDKDFSFFSKVLAISAVVFFFFQNQSLSERWSIGFYGRDEDGALFNLNVMGFNGLLFFHIFVALILYFKCDRIWIFVGATLTFFVLILSFSRTDYACALILVLFLIFTQFDKKQWPRLFLLCFIGVVGFYLVQRNFGHMFEVGKDFYLGKQEAAAENFITDRIMNNNVIRIQEAWLSDLSPITLLFGKGNYISHSWFSQALIDTGVVGLIYYIYYHAKFVIKWMNSIPKKWQLCTVVMLIVLMNDFSANCTFNIALPSVLSMIALACSLQCFEVYGTRELNIFKNQ